MGTRYSHLTLEERCRVRGLMEMGLGVTEIARRLGRHRSTIHRELERNRCVEGYRPDSAARRAWARKLRGSKIERSTRLRAQVEDRLAMGWSPEQNLSPRKRGSRGGWSWRDRSTGSAPSPSTATPTARPAGVRACRASLPNASPNAAGGERSLRWSSDHCDHADLVIAIIASEAGFQPRVGIIRKSA